VELVVGPLREDGAQELIASAELPGIGNVLERVADEVVAEKPDDGEGEQLRVRLSFHPA
jgi:hypothetical protein